MADLAIYRERFIVSARETVEIRVVSSAEDANVCASFYCATCGDELRWCQDRKIFECPSCGYELTATEASRLCNWHIEQVRALASLVGRKRGLLWRLLRWLRVVKNS